MSVRGSKADAANDAEAGSKPSERLGCRNGRACLPVRVILFAGEFQPGRRPFQPCLARQQSFQQDRFYLFDDIVDRQLGLQKSVKQRHRQAMHQRPGKECSFLDTQRIVRRDSEYARTCTANDNVDQHGPGVVAGVARRLRAAPF
jgi:hypothetical protein